MGFLSSFFRFMPVMPVFFLVFAASPLWSQAETEQGRPDDPVSYVGLTLNELIGRFGTPSWVYAARGLEEWQDDVVFVYNAGDFYIFRDRVWQVGLKAARGINSGDSRAVVSLVLGSQAVDLGNSTFYPLDDGSWPLMLRYDYDSAGKVQAIFIYRTDM